MNLADITTTPGWWNRPMCEARHPVADGMTGRPPRCVLDPNHDGPHSTCYALEWEQ